MRTWRALAVSLAGHALLLAGLASRVAIGPGVPPPHTAATVEVIPLTVSPPIDVTSEPSPARPLAEVDRTGAPAGPAPAGRRPAGAHRPRGSLVIVPEQRQDAAVGVGPDVPPGVLGTTPRSGSGDGAVPAPRNRPVSKARGPRALADYRRWPEVAPSRLRGKVIQLELHVDERGRVARVRVVAGISAEWNERAVRFARTFRFDPARDDDGRALAAAVRWHFILE